MSVMPLKEALLGQYFEFRQDKKGDFVISNEITKTLFAAIIDYRHELSDILYKYDEQSKKNSQLLEKLKCVAPILPGVCVEEWTHDGNGTITGTWAEDGSPYYMVVPHQLADLICELQELLPEIFETLKGGNK